MPKSGQRGPRSAGRGGGDTTRSDAGSGKPQGEARGLVLAIGLAGTLLGGLLSLAGGFLAARYQADNARSERRDAARDAAYVHFISTVNTMSNDLHQVSWAIEHKDDQVRDEYVEKVNTLKDVELPTAEAEVVLVAPRHVWVQARKVLAVLEADGGIMTAEDAESRSDALATQLACFTEAARGESASGGCTD